MCLDAAPKSTLEDTSSSAASNHNQTSNKSAPGSAAGASLHDAAQNPGDALPSTAGTASRPGTESSGSPAASFLNPLPVPPLLLAPQAHLQPRTPTLTPSLPPLLLANQALLQPCTPDLTPSLPSPTELSSPSPLANLANTNLVPGGCRRICKPKAWLQKKVAQQQRTIWQQQKELNRCQKLATDVEAAEAGAEAAVQQAKTRSLRLAGWHHCTPGRASTGINWALADANAAAAVG